MTGTFNNSRSMASLPERLEYSAMKPTVKISMPTSACGK